MSIDSVIFTETYSRGLTHPATGETLRTKAGAPLAIVVTSSESQPFRDLQAKYRNESIRNPNKKITAEMERRRMDELLAACTVSWNLEDDSGPIKFTRDAAMSIYGNPRYAWIRRQVADALFDEANFLGESKAA